MFRTTLKHEFRAVARIVLPLLIVLLIASMLMSVGFIIDGLLLSSPSEQTLSTPQALLYLLEGILTVGLCVLCLAISIAVFVMMVRRFYTSFFTDEGYLTFTLPVTIDCHLMVKIVSMIIWNVLSFVAIAVAVFIIAGGAEIGYGGVITEVAGTVWDELSYLFTMSLMYYENIPLIGVLFVLNYLLSFVFEILLMYFGISLGCMLVKRHRLIASIVCIISVNAVLSFINSVFSTLLQLTGIAESNPEMYFLIICIIGIVLSVAEIIGGYLGTRYILERKLNLD